MNRTFRTIIAISFIVVIIFCAIAITQNLDRAPKIDITEQKLYTLSDGTKSILAKLNQPLTINLYYARTAAIKAPDVIRQYNEYYFFVKAILEEYVTAAGGMVQLHDIDPRPFSDNEQEALRYGIKRFPITQDESFFFGLVVKTQFGAAKTIQFFAPDRQTFVEYDISYLIDSVITRQKNKIGVLSSLPVMGDNVTGYMAQMMQMQGQTPRPPWTFIRQLQQRYEVDKIETDIEEIKDIDLLLVVHPKELPEKTLFAIDQFILKGGRTIICLDPHCQVDQPAPQQQMQGPPPSQSSNLNKLLNTWGLDMPDDSFAGDSQLALTVSLRQNQMPQKFIGLLGLTAPSCFNPDNIISADLNDVKLLFSGILKQLPEKTPASVITPLLYTTAQGNSWQVSSPYELKRMDAQRLMKYFQPGLKPVNLACMITGKLSSSFPNGIDITDESPDKETPPQTRHLTGLTQAQDDCAVIVFADVDFISDLGGIAFQQSIFGTSVIGDNSALMTNSIENLLGSSDLISIRSRGNFSRPFTRVDEIEAKAEQETALEEDKINTQIETFQSELTKLANEALNRGENLIDASELSQSKTQLELKIRQAKVNLRQVQNKRRQEIEQLGSFLSKINMLLAPTAILLVAIILSIRRSILRRRYLSRTSD